MTLFAIFSLLPECPEPTIYNELGKQLLAACPTGAHFHSRWNQLILPLGHRLGILSNSDRSLSTGFQWGLMFGLHFRPGSDAVPDHLIRIPLSGYLAPDFVHVTPQRRQVAISVAIPLDLSHGAIVLDLPSNPPKSPGNDAYRSEDVLWSASNDMGVSIGNKCDNAAFWLKNRL
ncbi:hypothetical protein FIBSPDRAFT_892226 [Athelia psychrophila]|uniref:Uncharacterized protein n=1 Tax=Athelia psychrophila TaxID=1759441 RepID=A0A166IPU9_9AGAM|nr:hypothetical protein FIBSPDRAFT_892226 [Fibularhizoctonia sp. CBS 109695]